MSEPIDRIAAFSCISKAGGIAVWYVGILVVGLIALYIFSEINGCEINIGNLIEFNLFVGDLCYCIGAAAVARGLFKICSDNFATVAWTLFSILLTQVTLYDIFNYLITDGDYSRFNTWMNICFYVMLVIAWTTAGVSLLYNYKTGAIRRLGFAVLAFLAWRIFVVVFSGLKNYMLTDLGNSPCMMILFCDVAMTFAFLFVMSKTYK